MRRHPTLWHRCRQAPPGLALLLALRPVACTGPASPPTAQSTTGANCKDTGHTSGPCGASMHRHTAARNPPTTHTHALCVSGLAFGPARASPGASQPHGACSRSVRPPSSANTQGLQAPHHTQPAGQTWAAAGNTLGHGLQSTTHPPNTLTTRLLLLLGCSQARGASSSLTASGSSFVSTHENSMRRDAHTPAPQTVNCRGGCRRAAPGELCMVAGAGGQPPPGHVTKVA